MATIADELVDRLAAASAASGSVGAVVSVRLDGQQATAATGFADRHSARAVTVDTPFRLGSIAKVCTAASLQALLTEAGRSLDDPVVDLLPAALPSDARTATWRHLLTHRSGIDGTYWDGFGDGPDAIRRYADAVSDLPVVFEPGDSWGYSNSGYVLAGAAIEALSGKPYEQAVTDRLLEPFGLTPTALWVAQPPAGAATGHHLTSDGVRSADVPIGTRSLAPTGSSGFTTALNLLELAERLLAPAWEDLLLDATPMPPGGGPSATHQARGWRVHDWGDVVLFGHDGGSAGMGSFVRWMPATRCGIAVLSNTNPSAMLLWSELSSWFYERAGISVPGWIPRRPGAVAERELVGEYRARDATFTVSEGDGVLTLEVEGLGGTLQRSAILTPLQPGVYRSDRLITDPTRIVSVEQPHGRYRLLHAGPFTARRA